MDKSSSDNTDISISYVTLDNIISKEVKIPAPFNTTAWRWVALLLMNLLLLGDYVVIDNPQTLETQLEDILKLSTQEYSYLYSSWALPSIFVPFIGGYLTDYLGVRSTLILSCIILTLGQLVYFLGAHALSFAWMLAGRVIYALGSNPLNVAQIVIIYKWFQGREVALAMAISSTTASIGRALSSLIIPKIFEVNRKIEDPIFFGVLACVFSTMVCIIMMIWDKANDERKIAFDQDLAEETQELENSEKINLKDIRHFKLAVWLLVLNFGLTDGFFFSFNVFSNDFYHTKYEFTNSAAGNIISINYVLGAVSSVVFGVIVDKKGYRASIILYNSLLGVFGFLYFFIVPECAECISLVIPQIFFGLLIGINDAATFPSLPLVVDGKYLGTGFGLFFVMQNFLIFILPPIAAFISDSTSQVGGGFFWMLVFFSILACLTVVESLLLFLQDRKMGRVLDMTICSKEKNSDNSQEEESEANTILEEKSENQNSSLSEWDTSTSITYRL